MDEKVESTDAEGNRVATKLKGKDTQRFKSSYEKIVNLRTRERESNSRYSDPARRKNNSEERYQIETEIRNLVTDIFQNNVDLGLTYRKQADPRKAALG